MQNINNKRIAKNTIMLYIRMLLTMLVSLYTSRVVLNALGVSDYGLYSVVGGVVTLFSFLNGTLASGTQRFLTFALGEKNSEKLRHTFSAALSIHLALSLLVTILVETIGLWFMYNKLNIQPDRFEAALWVFHLSAITLFFSIMQVPYMSALIAHEKMDMYAYMSIFDVVMKLLIVYLLLAVNADKLKMYAVFYCCTNIISMFIYRLYCARKFKECHFQFKYDKNLYKDMLAFSGWNVFGCLAWTCNGQGINILLNLFFGTIINAARGISNQISGIVTQFVTNFQTAVNPQIVKLYASGQKNEMIRLVFNNSKYAAFLMLFLSIPLMLEMHFVLKQWLGIVPSYTVYFTQIILVQGVFQTMGRPIVTVVHAVGKMKIVNITAGAVLLLILPISYILLKLGVSVITVYIVAAIPWLLETLIELLLLKKFIEFPLLQFYKSIYIPVLCLAVLMAIFPLIFRCMMVEGWIRFFIVCTASLISSSLVLYNWGFGKTMKIKVKQIILSRLCFYK